MSRVRTPFGTAARSLEEDTFFEGYEESAKAADAPSGNHIDPETGLLKLDVIETPEIVYRKFREYGVLPGSIKGHFEVVGAGPQPENVCRMVPYIHESVPFIYTSDVGPRNVRNMMRRLGNGGPAVNVYQATNLRGERYSLDTRNPVWKVFARKHEETGRRVYAGVKGADLSYFDGTYDRYLDDIAKPIFRDVRKVIDPGTLAGWFGSYFMESAADDENDMQHMFTRLTFGMKRPKSDPMESGEVYPFAALVAENRDDEGYHSERGTDHTEVPIDEQGLEKMLRGFPVHIDITPCKYGYREASGDGKAVSAMVLTGYTLPEGSDLVINS